MKKRILAAVLMLTLIFTFTACASGTDDSNTSTSERTFTPVTSTVTSVETSAVTSYESSDTSCVSTVSDEERVDFECNCHFCEDCLYPFEIASELASSYKDIEITQEYIDAVKTKLIETVNYGYSLYKTEEYMLKFFLSLADIDGDDIPEYFCGISYNRSMFQYGFSLVKDLKLMFSESYLWDCSEYKIFGGKKYIDGEDIKFYSLYRTMGTMDYYYVDIVKLQNGSFTVDTKENILGDELDMELKYMQVEDINTATVEVLYNDDDIESKIKECFQKYYSPK